MQHLHTYPKEWINETKDAGNMHLVCFLASVIKDHARLRYFGILLDSIQNQRIGLAGVFISIYMGGEVANVNVLEFVNSHLATDYPVHILRQRREKRQFEQFSDMQYRLDKVYPCPAGKTDFIMFSDDDDIWHPLRTTAYYAIWSKSQTVEDISAVSAMSIKTEVKHLNPNCSAAHGDSNVNGMLECGCAVMIEHAKDIANVLTEYHNYISRPHVLKEFIQANPFIVRYNRFADMDFRWFLITYKPGKAKTIHTHSPHWLYFYRKGPPNYSAVTNPINRSVKYNIRENPREMATYIDYWLDMVESPYISTSCKEANSEEQIFTRIYTESCNSPDDIAIFVHLWKIVKQERAKRKI